MVVGLGFTALAVAIALGFFMAMLALLEIGRRMGVSQLVRHGADSREGVGVADAAVYGLFALLIGFSFSHATTRFDNRRELVAKEVNAIGTAWERIDALPADKQPALRDGFRRYLDALIASYSEPGTVSEALLEPPAVTRAHRAIWTGAIAATLAPGGEPARMLLLPAINEMFDLAEEERLARRMHPPPVIFAMLGIAALAVALFAGYGIASKSVRNSVYMIGVAASIAAAMYVIIELEYPRLGLIRVSDMDRALVELRATIQ
jgi:hypothetical protein